MPLDVLTLEPFAPSHYATLSSWFATEHEAVQWGGPAVHHPLDVAQLQRMLPDAGTPPSHLAWMALRDHAPVGHAQVICLDPRAGVARLGRIVIGPKHRGRGLAVPMLRLVIAEAFAIPGILRIDLGVYTWNAGAIKTYRRLGFEPGAIKHPSTTLGSEHWDGQEMSLHRSRP